MNFERDEFGFIVELNRLVNSVDDHDDFKDRGYLEVGVVLVVSGLLLNDQFLNVILAFLSDIFLNLLDEVL